LNDSYLVQNKQGYMQYRTIKNKDLPTLFQIRISTRENKLSMDELAQLGITLESMTKALSDNVKEWLCEIDNNIVGFAMGEKATGEMLVIALLPAYEGLGIGKQLLQRVEEWLFSEGHSKLWLTTSLDQNLRAYGFYRKLGWLDAGELKGKNKILRKIKQ
jgi:ribosomal protein S18 acetylase RimI-like enzyme